MNMEQTTKKAKMDNSETETLGDSLFIEGFFAAAAECYAKSAETRENYDLLTKSANTHINLGCYKSALNDCDKVLQNKPNHEESIHTKVKSLWGLKQYSDALDLINTFPPTETLLDLKMQTEKMMKQTEGEYDIMEIMSLPRDRRNHFAEFTGPVKIGPSPGKGRRGLFATKDINPGDLLLCSKAYAVVFGNEEKWQAMTGVRRGRLFGLLYTISRKLIWDPMTRTDFCDLSPGSRSTKNPDWLFSQCEEFPELFLTMDTDTPTPEIKAEIYNETLNRIRANYFEIGRKHVEDDILGVWILPSYINHSCINMNANWMVFGDMMMIRAVKSIKEGEEITLMYTGASLRDYTFAEHGFKCKCELCRFEKSENNKTRMEIESLRTIIKENSKNSEERSLQLQYDLVKKLSKIRESNPEMNTLAAEPCVMTLMMQLLIGRHLDLFVDISKIYWEAVTKVGAFEFGISVNSLLLSCYLLMKVEDGDLLKRKKHEIETEMKAIFGPEIELWDASKRQKLLNKLMIDMGFKPTQALLQV